MDAEAAKGPGTLTEIEATVLAYVRDYGAVIADLTDNSDDEVVCGRLYLETATVLDALVAAGMLLYTEAGEPICLLTLRGAVSLKVHEREERAPEHLPDLVDGWQMAKRLGNVSRDMLCRWAKDGHIPSVSLPGGSQRRLFCPGDVMNALRQHGAQSKATD